MGEALVLAKEKGGSSFIPLQGESKGKGKIGEPIRVTKAKKCRRKEEPPKELRIPIKSCLGMMKGWLDVN